MGLSHFILERKGGREGGTEGQWDSLCSKCQDYPHFTDVETKKLNDLPRASQLIGMRARGTLRKTSLKFTRWKISGAQRTMF